MRSPGRLALSVGDVHVSPSWESSASAVRGLSGREGALPVGIRAEERVEVRGDNG